MKLGVIGSRNFTNYTQLAKYLSKKMDVEKIISGGSEGADKLAEKYAIDNDIPFESYPLDKQAIVRNSDMVIAFWDGKSSGTQEVLQIAKKAGKRIEVVFLEKKATEAPFGYFFL